MGIWRKKKKKHILKVFRRFSQSLKDCSFDQESYANFLVCCIIQYDKHILNRISIEFDLGYFAEDQSDDKLTIINLSFSWHIGCNQSG